MASNNLVGSIVMFLGVYKLMAYLIIDGLLEPKKYGNKILLIEL